MPKADGTVLIDTKINTDGAKTGTKEMEKTLVGLKDSLKLLPQSFKDLPTIMQSAFSSASKSVKSISPKVRNLQDDIDRYADALYYAEQAGYGIGDAKYDEAYIGLQRAKKAAEEYRKKLLGIDNGNKKATKSGNKFNKSLKKTEKSAKGAQMSLGRMLAMSVLFSTVFQAISAVTSGLKEGMDNLAQYSNDTNRALSLLMSSLTQLKNAFATAFSPLIEVAAPALSQFIKLLAEAVTWTSQLLSALTGKDTFVRAVEVQQDYADSLDKTKDETESAADATEKALAPFDQLIQITSGKKNNQADTSTELTPDQMFVMEEVSNDVKMQADAIKETLSKLFEPLKQSWLENGPQVLDSLKNTFSAFKQLATDVGKSFMQVWNAEGYGKAITDDLLITFANLVDTVGNLVTNFDRAWVSGDTGTNILRHLGDIILEITGFFREASESLKNWSAGLDFSPLLESFDRILVAIRPIVSDVGDLLLWLLDNVLLPLAEWGVEQALPAVFDLISAALELLHTVLEALKPLGVWLWENFLQPLSEWTGDTFITAIEIITSLIESLIDIFNQLYKSVLEPFINWFSENVLPVIEPIVEAVGKVFEEVFFVGIPQYVQSVFQVLSGIIQFISGVFTGNWTAAWNGIKMIFSGVWNGILAIITTVAKSIYNIVDGIISAVEKALNALNKLLGKSETPTGGFSGNGYYSYSYPRSAYAAIPYKVPRLATGTVVPPRAGEFAAILGDNNRETEVVSPLSTMKQALKEALMESGFAGGQRDINIELVLDGQRFARAVYKANNQETQRVGVRMVTNG